MDLNETLSLILQELQAMKTGQQRLQEDVTEIKDDVSVLKERTKQIEITLENDITQRLDSLADGYKLNGEKLDNIKTVVDDLDSTVTALDVVAQFQSSKPITLQIIK